MEYYLAKQLKDAGFPQHLSARDEDFYEEGQVSNISLSELIKECGDGFDRLQRRGENAWLAFPTFDFIKTTNNMHSLSEVQTPEEAVAKLWLELNKS